MAVPQQSYRFAYALTIDGPSTVRGATTDLPEDAAVATLGAFLKGHLISVSTVTTALPNYFYGVRRKSGTVVVINNEDGLIDTSQDWRLSPFILQHYDRNLDVVRTELTGIIVAQSESNGRVTFELGSVNDGILRDLLPAAVIDPKAGSPFDDSASPGAPVPVVFGRAVVAPPSLNVTNASIVGDVSSWDYGAGFGDDLVIEAVYADTDVNRPGLEVLGSWAPAPGSPAYIGSEPVTALRETQFSVTGDQRHRYTPGMPLRLKIGSSAYRYTVVAEYIATTDPHRVAIFDPLVASGLTSVELIGDYQVIRDVYTTVTDGLLPEPATGQAITAIRVFDQEDGGIQALVRNPRYPSGSGGASPVDVIADIIENPVWGLSTHVQQTCNPFFLTFARIGCAFAGLDGAIEGALGYDRQQRDAEQTLDALLMIARARLSTDEQARWVLTVDSELTSAATFCYGPGEERGPRIKRIEACGRVAVNEAIRNLVLHWMPSGRAMARANLRAADYVRFSTKAVSGVGRDRHIYNPFIRSQDVAERVLQYLAEKLKGADERLIFTAGPEARDRVPGEVITVVDTLGGASGEWQISEIAKTLGDVRIAAIRHRTEAYDAPSGIVHSAEPSEAPNTRTDKGTSANFVPNPEPSPPTRLSDESPGFAPAYTPHVDGVPHGWTLGHVPGDTTVEELALDKSAEVAANTVSGHYLRLKFSSVAPTGSFARSDACEGLVSDPFAIRQGSDHIVSFYGSREGFYVNCIENDAPTFTQRLLTLIRDDTDTDRNGWPRYYARWRPMPDTTTIRIGVGVSSTDAYELAGIMVEAVTGAVRKPTGWRRTAVAPLVLQRSTSISFDGSAEYLVPLIRAGDYVHGATTRITAELEFGWGAAPGSPAYLTDELNPTIRATRFEVTGDQAAHYRTGRAVRFKTSATFVIDPDSYATSTVVAYHPAIGDPPGPIMVEIADDVIDSGLNSVELQAVEWQVGTAADPGAWGDRLTHTAVDAQTTGRDYRGGSSHAFSPVDAMVRVAPTDGTIADGALTVTLHYTRSSPTVGA